jgi:hypothetical protein
MAHELIVFTPLQGTHQHEPEPNFPIKALKNNDFFSSNFPIPDLMTGLTAI